MQKGFYSSPDTDIEDALYELVFPDDRRIDGMVFLHGTCGIFALALHDIFNYDIGWILDDNEINEAENPWHHLVHVFCHYRAPDGTVTFFDVRGRQSDEEKFQTPFEDFFVEPAYGFALSYEDIRDNILMDMSAEEFSRFYNTAIYFITQGKDIYSSKTSMAAPHINQKEESPVTEALLDAVKEEKDMSFFWIGGPEGIIVPAEDIKFVPDEDRYFMPSINMKIFHSNQKEMEQFSSEIKYWSNGIGEIHNHGVSIPEEELPSDLQRAYKELWTDEFGSLCYLVETPQGFGVALLNEYDECFAADCNLTMDKLFQSALEDGAAISKRPEFQSADIYIGEYSGFCECHELIVVFPASIPVEQFRTAAALLDDLAYQSANLHRPSLIDQIQAASSRASDVLHTGQQAVKAPSSER